MVCDVKSPHGEKAHVPGDFTRVHFSARQRIRYLVSPIGFTVILWCAIPNQEPFIVKAVQLT